MGFHQALDLIRLFHCQLLKIRYAICVLFIGSSKQNRVVSYNACLASTILSGLATIMMAG